MSAIAIFTFLRRYGWIFAVAALAWWLHHQSATIASQRAEIAAVRSDLAAEKLTRARDVAGLTALSSGLAAAAVDTRSDQKALTDAIQTPTPVSPGLGDLLQRLRDNDAASTKPAARGTGTAAGR